MLRRRLFFNLRDIASTLLLSGLFTTASGTRLVFEHHGAERFSIEPNGKVTSADGLISGLQASPSGTLLITDSISNVNEVKCYIRPSGTHHGPAAVAGISTDVAVFSDSGLGIVSGNGKEAVRLTKQFGNLENPATEISGSVYYGASYIDYYTTDTGRVSTRTVNLLAPGGSVEGKQVETAGGKHCSYFLKDHLGSTRDVISSDDGTVEESYILRTG